jgi:hypothetical protein
MAAAGLIIVADTQEKVKIQNEIIVVGPVVIEAMFPF